MANFPELLVSGDNVLALHALNRNVSNRDFYISQIRLSAAAVPESSSTALFIWGLLVSLRRRSMGRAGEILLIR